MTSSNNSNGKASSIQRPYMLAVTSHKGGTGRTTLACALAWMWGSRGLNVALVDADPVKATSLVAADQSGTCPWPHVQLIVANQGVTRIPAKQDIVIIDSPPATEPLAQKVFQQCDGVVICCLADSLALNTLPAATRSVKEARQKNAKLRLLGIVVNIFNEVNLAQTRCLSLLRGARGGLFVEPPIPSRPEMRDWPMKPGSPLPSGPAQKPLRDLADTFRDQMAESGWSHMASRKGEYLAHTTHS